MVGKIISHYRILEKLGKGGMGVVYKAEDTRLNREVALKFLPKDLIVDGDSKKRFRREAEAAALLNHPNIITIHETDEYRGRNYIVMEYASGGNLRQKMEEVKDSVTSAEKTRDIIVKGMQICRGLGKAHQAGIIHRDINPGNILIDGDGQVKISDFGLAKLMDTGQSSGSKSTKGTAAYMSPEQIAGRKTDQRSDIWSFGAVLYEMISGKVPFKEEYMQALFYAILNEEPVPVSDLYPQVPKGLVKIVHKCLTKEVNKRYATVSEVLADLTQLKQDLPVDKYAVKIKKIPKPYRNVRKIVVPIVIVVLLILFVLTPNPGREALKDWLFPVKIPEIKHLAVLPLLNSGDSPLQKAYTKGTAARIIAKLTSLEQLQKSMWVVPVSEMQIFKVNSVEKAVKSFRISLVLTCRVIKDQDQVIHKLNLLDAETGKKLRSRVYTDHNTNMSGLQDGIIREIVEMLDIEWGPAVEKILTAGGTSSHQAFQIYLEGLGFLQESENTTSIDRSIDLFNQVIKMDNFYYEAYASLGRAYLYKYRITREKGWLEKAKSSCNRALKINKGLYSAYITLGYIYRETENNKND